eukprot:2644409-Prymnesium_polylepis.3
MGFHTMGPKPHAARPWLLPHDAWHLLTCCVLRALACGAPAACPPSAARSTTHPSRMRAL